MLRLSGLFNAFFSSKFPELRKGASLLAQGNLPTPAGDKLSSTTDFNCPMEPGILVNDSHWFSNRQLRSTRAPIESGSSVIAMEIQNQVQEISRSADRFCRNLSKRFTFPSTKNFNLLHISTNGFSHKKFA
ncbi:hypothetical protein NL676_015873 [Syzygium grande]|nr:hypothetical protein NL676_015873 [Syzygium grande]